MTSNQLQLDTPEFRVLLADSFGLTKSQLDVLLLMTTGQMIKECSRTLNLSPNTIKCHRTAILKKLGVNCATKLVAKVYEQYFDFIQPRMANQ